MEVNWIMDAAKDNGEKAQVRQVQISVPKAKTNVLRDGEGQRWSVLKESQSFPC